MAQFQHIVVMGVSGSGKSTVGAELAEVLGWQFIEGDALHPAANIAKMSAGIPLTDEDRWPWLRALAGRIAEGEAARAPTVVGCSALKRSYRDVLRQGAPRVRFVHVWGDRQVLETRLNARPGHFFPPALLDTQIATLEHLAPDEDGVIVDLAWTTDRQVASAREQLGL
ncbi:MAG: gluconokinase [Paracoccus sp. (in: a-proteobacteria)]|nr:gluconokinase [Paracoccus sp. (in: a-proteobacteria)]